VRIDCTKFARAPLGGLASCVLALLSLLLACAEGEGTVAREAAGRSRDAAALAGCDAGLSGVREAAEREREVIVGAWAPSGAAYRYDRACVAAERLSCAYDAAGDLVYASDAGFLYTYERGWVAVTSRQSRTP